MKKNTLVFLFALCPLIPASARFAYGVVLAVSFVWFYLAGLGFRELVKAIGPGEAGPYIEMTCIGAAATLFNIVLQWLFPVLSVSLGLYVYLSAFSFIVLVSIDVGSLKSDSFIPVLPFIPILLAFSLARELLGYGSVSLPVPAGLVEYAVVPGFEVWGLGFWGTAGGAFILLGFATWLTKFIQRKTSAARRGA